MLLFVPPGLHTKVSGFHNRKTFFHTPLQYCPVYSISQRIKNIKKIYYKSVSFLQIKSMTREMWIGSFILCSLLLLFTYFLYSPFEINSVSNINNTEIQI